MTTVPEASKIVLDTNIPNKIIEIPLKEAIGKVLQEDILADRPFPPFHRVAMDGIAINFNEFNKHPFLIIENIQFAGEPQKKLKDVKNGIEVMTGAALPDGCDTVIKYEDVELSEEKENKIAHIKNFPNAAGENIHRKGSDRIEGEVLIHKGRLISPAEVAVAATVGKAFIKVNQIPKIALISTGDELVAPSVKPLPHQIRRSNIFALKASLKEHFFDADDFHLNDDKEQLYEKLKNILVQYDVLILSGGVSMGKADFVPEILVQLGVNKLFHKVAQRPGKPFWFGVFDNSKVVFALPGNPVSTFITFYKYCLPWLKKNNGMPNPVLTTATLSEDVSFHPSLTYFLQVKVNFGDDGKIHAVPHSGKGSGDLANLADCDGILELSSSETFFKAGNNYPLILFRKLF